MRRGEFKVLHCQLSTVFDKNATRPDHLGKLDVIIKPPLLGVSAVNGSTFLVVKSIVIMAYSIHKRLFFTSLPLFES